MIFPSKHLSPNRALITIAAEVYECIQGKQTVSSIWEEYKKSLNSTFRISEVSFDWFILSVDLLFLMGLIDSYDGYIIRIKKD